MLKIRRLGGIALAEVTLEALARDDPGLHDFVTTSRTHTEAAAKATSRPHRFPAQLAVFLANQAARDDAHDPEGDVQTLVWAIAGRAVLPVLPDLWDEFVRLARGLLAEDVQPDAVKAAVSLFGVEALPLPGVGGGVLDWVPATAELRQRIGAALVHWSRQANDQNDKEARRRLRAVNVTELLAGRPRLHVRPLNTHLTYAINLYRLTRARVALTGPPPSDSAMADVARRCGLTPDRLRKYVQAIPRQTPEQQACRWTAAELGLEPSYVQRRVLSAPFIVTVRK